MFTIKTVQMLVVPLTPHVPLERVVNVLLVHALDVRLAHVAVRLVEPYLQFRDPTDRLFMLEALQVQITECIKTSLECGQLQTQVEPTLCRLANVVAHAPRKLALLSLLQ